jgi:hypothetical protein
MADYFTKETDKYIQKFLETIDASEKHKIFDEKIRPAFEKLIENLIYVYGFYHLDDVETLKKDCLTNLYEMLPKYNLSKSTKGFSYFNVIAKNWFIFKTRERNRRIRIEGDNFANIDEEMSKNSGVFGVSPIESIVEEREFWISFHNTLEKWRSKLVRKTERQILEAIIFLMRNPDLVAIYNKKAVYLYLRELTGLNTKQVVINLKKIKSLYSQWKEEYDSNGVES